MSGLDLGAIQFESALRSDIGPAIRVVLNCGLAYLSEDEGYALAAWLKLVLPEQRIDDTQLGERP